MKGKRSTTPVTSVEALLVAARDGDPLALSQLLRHFRPQLERMCRRLCNGDETVDDVLQESYVSILRNLRTFRGESSFLTWAYTILRTSRSRQLRKGRLALEREASLDVLAPVVRESLAQSFHQPDEIVADRELGTSMLRALSHLSEVDRQVLLLRDLQGFTASEVAQRLGLTVPAVKTRLHRARVAMRGRLTVRAALQAA